MEKQALRSFMQEKKRAMTQQQVEKTSQALASMLFAHPAYRQANSLFAYASCNQEVRTLPILQRALADGKRVALPKITEGAMHFFWVEDLSALAPGFGGIMEPASDFPAMDEAALILTPGLAFDPLGHRCGYGGGYYDRYLALHPHHPTIALCYGFQMVDTVPFAPHDRPVDTVLFSEVEA